MDQQGRDMSFSPAVYGVPDLQSQRGGLPAPMLRPLSTGEVLDRTFTLYRKQFWLFTGIGALPAAIVTLSSVARMIYLAVNHRSSTVLPGAPPNVLADAVNNLAAAQIYFLPATILFVLAYGVSHAAIVDAVGRITQATPVSAGSAYRAVTPHWLRWAGIAMRQFWSFFWPLLPPLLLLGVSLAIPSVRNNAVAAGLIFLAFGVLMGGGFVFGIINLLRVTLAIPAGVQENFGVNAAIRRSRMLVAGRKGRIFLALLLVYALQLVAGGVQAPLVLLALTTHGGQQTMLQAIELIVQFVTTALVGPVASIALCLFYIDERVRREGFDIELLMRRTFTVPPATPPASAAASPLPAGPSA